MVDRYERSWFRFATFCAALSAGIIYLALFSVGFYFDDFPTIASNKALLHESVGNFFFSHTRWVVYLFNAVTVRMVGASVWWFRFQNIIVLSSIAIMAYGWFARLLERFDDSWSVRYRHWIALIAAWLTVAHPAQTQTTFYITQCRLEGLVALFTLTSLYALMRFTESRTYAEQGAWMVAMMVSAVLGSGTKEAFVVTPLLGLLALIWTDGFSEPEKRVRTIGALAVLMFVTGIGFGMLPRTFSLQKIVTLQHDLVSNRGNLLASSYQQVVSHLDYVKSQARVLLHYLRIFVLPNDLSFDYDIVVYQHWAEQLISWVILLGMVIAIIGGIRRWGRHSATFGILWFLVALAPRLFVPSTELITDYKTFVASQGICLIIAYCLVKGFCQLKKRDWGAFSRSLSLVVPGIVITFLSYQRIDVWKNPITFWQEVVEHTPTKARAHNNLANAYLASGYEKEAVIAYKKAIACDSNYAEPLINLGGYLQNKGEHSQARDLYVRALKLVHEPHPELYLNIALLHEAQGKRDKAMIAVSDAIKLNNSYGKALYYKALWEYEAGNYEVAASTAERSSSYSEGAIKRSATLVAARAWYRLGDYIRSEGLFARVDNRFMTDHDQFCYGVVAYRAYRYEEARERFADLYKKHPENDEVMYNLAQSLFHSGNYLEAFGFFDRCASLDRYPYAKAHAQQCLEKLGV